MLTFIENKVWIRKSKSNNGLNQKSFNQSLENGSSFNQSQDRSILCQIPFKFGNFSWILLAQIPWNVLLQIHSICCLNVWLKNLMTLYFLGSKSNGNAMFNVQIVVYGKSVFNTKVFFRECFWCFSFFLLLWAKLWNNHGQLHFSKAKKKKIYA